MKYELHPACDAWPVMSQDDIAKLAEDIKANGLRDPATLSVDGRMLDGRNRMLACEIASVELTTVTYDGDDEVSFVISKNLHRRHLTKNELAFLGSELAKLKRGGHGANQHVGAKPLNSGLAKSTKQISTELGVGCRNIEAAKTVNREGTENVIAFAKTNQVTVQAAAAFVKNTPRDEQAKADVATVKRKGNTFKKGGKSKIKPPKATLPRYRGPQDYPGAEDIKGLDKNQRVHLHSYTAKQMLDAQSLVSLAIGPIAAVAAIQANGEEFFDAVDKMLSWKVRSGAKYGEQIDFAKKAKRDLEVLDRCLDTAITRLASIKAEVDARNSKEKTA